MPSAKQLVVIFVVALVAVWVASYVTLIPTNFARKSANPTLK